MQPDIQRFMTISDRHVDDLAKQAMFLASQHLHTNRLFDQVFAYKHGNSYHLTLPTTPIDSTPCYYQGLALAPLIHCIELAQIAGCTMLVLSPNGPVVDSVLATF